MAGYRVLDFSWVVAGPFTTMILADMGAEVIKVEATGLTERQRGFGPYVAGMSTFRFSLDRGKKSMAIDLRTPKGRELIYRMVPRMDVVVENFTPGTMARLGVEYDTLRQNNSRLVYASSSAFGQYGPYADRRALDIIVQAFSGLLSRSRSSDGPPIYSGVSIVDLTAGVYTALGIVAALLERERSGQGQYIDIGMLDCALSLLENLIIRYSARDEVQGRRQWDSRFVYPEQAFRVKDGWMVVAMTHDWKGLCQKIGRPDLGEDPRFQTNRQRIEHLEELAPQLDGAFRERTVAEWTAELEAFCAVAPVNTIEVALADAHVQARNAVVSVPVPGAGEKEVLVPNSPLKMSRTPAQVQGPAPRYQEHTADVLREVLGMADGEIEALESEGVISRLTPDVPG
jgi:CoA:oxalate CoA-transferase